jgi:hypothetical protein
LKKIRIPPLFYLCHTQLSIIAPKFTTAPSIFIDVYALYGRTLTIRGDWNYNT